MIVFFLLLLLVGITYLVAFLLASLGIHAPLLDSHQARVRLALSLWFIAAGALHFLATNVEIVMMPAFLPAKVALMYISGVAEILGGLGLLIPRVRREAGIGLIVLLLAVFPANLNVALNHITGPGLINDPLQQWLRLPLQFVLIAVVAWATQSRATQPTVAMSEM